METLLGIAFLIYLACIIIGWLWKQVWFWAWIFIIIIIYLIVSAIKSALKNEENKQSIKKDTEYENRENLLDKIDYMTGQEFEKFLVEILLPLDGYININGTSYTGDYGVDIIAEKNGIKCAFQCKRFNNKVSNKAIQEIVAGKKHYKCDKAIVITNNYYTKNAKELAEDCRVELLDRDYIIQILKKNMEPK